MKDHFLQQALRSAFYQKKLAGSTFSRFEDIPFTTKAELRDADPFDLLGTGRENIASYHETSGTTGNPTSSWYSHADVRAEAEIVAHSDLQLCEKDLVLNRYTFTLAVASFIFYWAADVAKAGHISLAKSQISSYKRVLQTIQRTNPTIVADIPFELEILAGVAKRLGLQLPTPNLRALLVAGELLPPSRKKWLETLWGVPAYNLFGSTETGGVVMSCSHGSLHVNNPHVKVEVLNAEGKAAGFGEVGHCVISTVREGMPVLRYWNEDLIELQESSCGCGRTGPVLVHYGRAEDCLCVQDRILTMYQLIDAVYSLSSVPMLWRFRAAGEQVVFEYQSFDGAKSPSVEEELEALLGIRLEARLTTLLSGDDLFRESGVTKYKYLIRS